MRVRRLPGVAALLTAGVVVVSGCGTQHMERPAQTPLPPVPSPAAAQQGPAAAPEAAVTAPRKTLRLGAKGKAVTWMQKRLTELGYRPGKADGQYGGTTLAAVWAFQKVNGIKPTSTIAKRTWEALEAPRAPKVLVPGGKATRAEVNLTKQIMVLYVRGQVKLITHISSGSGIPYCETTTWQGKEQRFCGSARTPTGNYRTTWRVSGWHKSYLGELYNPIFFNGGIAFHGALSVPLYPASHGCVRMPMNVAGELPGLLGKGVPVHVRGAYKRA
ncbi:Putative peptidoglycan binding domain 1:ErfK/YbiS/YcfS/YnhG [[Actinomadura] parvosata subsp. kistnae]|uniref:L,D-transpeptidase family protein n=1 Tax=[Actinomadura] parvosata TaxID=1955412 RepID=UPI000D2C1E27|nr:L,D-transpeptidase family protein [Nonomuraea sp. ATCC 55076]SPL96078.1 Putative peptidoglycan binding domain 1:ErfK/YbiS/YcfS/YnhG [Actinomadura parvosata subsp. kistnae]